MPRSGYYTSRPRLKQLSRDVHVALYAAELLFARRGAHVDAAERLQLWDALEHSRRQAAIFQHHDAITGTFCAAAEGCPGIDQDIGSHDVLGDYAQMLQRSLAGAQDVFLTLAHGDLIDRGWLRPVPRAAASTTTGADAHGLNHTQLSADPVFAGDVLMGNGKGGEPVVLFVYNPLTQPTNEAVTVPVPICAVTVADAHSRAPVPSQTTASLDVSDRTAPYYGFAVSFIATLPPLGWRAFVLTPVPFARRHCQSASHAQAGGSSSPTAHMSMVESPAEPPSDADRSFEGHATAVAHRHSRPEPATSTPPSVLENRFLSISIDPRFGMSAVLDKASGVSYPLSHRLHAYEMAPEVLHGAGPAYAFNVIRPAQPLLSERLVRAGELQCQAWRATRGCRASNSRDRAGDAPCAQPTGGPNASGYCECTRSIGLRETEVVKRHAVDCDASGSRSPIPCAKLCAAAGNLSTPALAATLARGPVLHESRLQITAEHSERIRLWQTDDPELGRRIELGVSVGPLEPMTELFSRFTLLEAVDLAKQSRVAHTVGAADAADATVPQLYTEDNGYEAIARGMAPADERAPLGPHIFPSQQSAFLRAGGHQLSIALDRSQGVAHVAAGKIDLFQHRRSLPFRGQIIGHTPVVLDDTDRIFSRSWLSIGNVTAATRARHEHKRRLFAPPVLLYGRVDALRVAAEATRDQAMVPPLGDALRLQSVRSTGANASEMVVRVQHMYAVGEDPQRSVRQSFDLDALLRTLVPARTPVGVQETTLDGAQPVGVLQRRRRFPTSDDGVSVAWPAVRRPEKHDEVGPASRTTVSIEPMQLRTWRVQMGSA